MSENGNDRMETCVSHVVIVGATPGGIMAAIAAAREGFRVMLLERTDHIGGLPANGLGATDIATQGTVGGLFMEFVRRIRGYYASVFGEDSQQVADCAGGYLFEPSVAEKVFEGMLADHPRVEVRRQRQFDAEEGNVELENNRIRGICVSNRETGAREAYRGQVFIDATYEGDLAAAAGVPYRVGREDAKEFSEPYAGRIYKYWDGPVVAGSTGHGDNAIQSYNYRLPLTRRPDLRVPIEKPREYNREEYISLIDDVCSGAHAGVEMLEVDQGFLDENRRRSRADEKPLIPGDYTALNGIGRLVNQIVVPNGKTDSNNQHLALLSTDLPEENWPWPTFSWQWRDQFARRLRSYIEGLLWFAQNDSELPEWFRKAAGEWGLSRDEYVDNGHFPRQVYVREARRIQGMYFFTAHDALPEKPGARPPLHRASITSGHYPLDSHAVRKRECGKPCLEGLFSSGDARSFGTEPYTIPYGVMVPQETRNLLVPVAVSGSHVGFSTLRMEPCWMALGEAAGVAAGICIGDETDVQSVPVGVLQDRLLDLGACLVYIRDLDPSHPAFAAVQRFALKGCFPDWDARLDEPVSQQDADEWTSKLGINLLDVSWKKGVTLRGEFLQHLDEMLSHEQPCLTAS